MRQVLVLAFLLALILLLPQTKPKMINDHKEETNYPFKPELIISHPKVTAAPELKVSGSINNIETNGFARDYDSSVILWNASLVELAPIDDKDYYLVVVSQESQTVINVTAYRVSITFSNSGIRLSISLEFNKIISSSNAIALRALRAFYDGTNLQIFVGYDNYTAGKYPWSPKVLKLVWGLGWKYNPRHNYLFPFQRR